MIYKCSKCKKEVTDHIINHVCNACLNWKNSNKELPEDEKCEYFDDAKRYLVILG